MRPNWSLIGEEQTPNEIETAKIQQSFQTKPEEIANSKVTSYMRESFSLTSKLPKLIKKKAILMTNSDEKKINNIKEVFAPSSGFQSKT